MDCDGSKRLYSAARQLVSNTAVIDAVLRCDVKKLRHSILDFLDVAAEVFRAGADVETDVSDGDQVPKSWGRTVVLAVGEHGRFRITVKLLILAAGQQTSEHAHLNRVEIHTPLNPGLKTIVGPDVLRFVTLPAERNTFLIPPFIEHQFVADGAGGVIASIDIEMLDRICLGSY